MGAGEAGDGACLGADEVRGGDDVEPKRGERLAELERLLLPDRVERQVDPAALDQMVLVGGGLAVAAEPEALDGALLGDEGDAPRERAYAAVLAPALRDAGHARQRGSAEPLGLGVPHCTHWSTPPPEVGYARWAV